MQIDIITTDSCSIETQHYCVVASRTCVHPTHATHIFGRKKCFIWRVDKNGIIWWTADNHPHIIPTTWGKDNGILFYYRTISTISFDFLAVMELLRDFRDFPWRDHGAHTRGVFTVFALFKWMVSMSSNNTSHIEQKCSSIQLLLAHIPAMKFSIPLETFATAFAWIIRTWPLLLITSATDVSRLTITLERYSSIEFFCFV